MNRRKFIQNSLIASVAIPVVNFLPRIVIKREINEEDINGKWNISPFDKIFGGIKAGSFYKIYPDFKYDNSNSHSQNILLINTFCDSLYAKLLNNNRSNRILIRKYSQDFELIMKYLFVRGYTKDSLNKISDESILELENEYEKSDIFKNQNDYYDKMLKEGKSIIYIFDHKTNNDLHIMPSYPIRCNELNNSIEVEFSYPILKNECNGKYRILDKIINVCLISEGIIYHFHLSYNIKRREIN